MPEQGIKVPERLQKGMVTDQKDLTDEMYEKASMHDEKGWYLLVKIS